MSGSSSTKRSWATGSPGSMAGYLLWSDRLPNGPQAITVLEHMTGHPMGPSGRELVAFAAELGPAPCPRGSRRPNRRRVTPAHPPAAGR